MQRIDPKILLAIGLLIISGSSLAIRFIMPVNDLMNGLMKGFGIGLMVFALYRMKQRPSAN